MTLDLRGINCDECGNGIGEGDVIYCRRCWDNLIDEKNEMETEIESLREKIDSMELQLYKYENEAQDGQKAD